MCMVSLSIWRLYDKVGKTLSEMGGDIREMLRRQHRCPRRILMPLCGRKEKRLFYLCVFFFFSMRCLRDWRFFSFWFSRLWERWASAYNRADKSGFGCGDANEVLRKLPSGRWIFPSRGRPAVCMIWRGGRCVDWLVGNLEFSY